MIKVGDAIPSMTLKHMTEEGMAEITTDEIFKGKTVVFFGVPGAYTPTCSNAHMPGFVAKAEDFKQKGVDAIVCLAVNDPFVARAWCESQSAADKITMLPDSNAELTTAMGLDFDGSGAGLGTRSKRFAMVVRDGVVQSLSVEDAPGQVEVSSADKVLAEL